jgi:glycerol dehydrogenase
MHELFFPQSIFAVEEADPTSIPRVLIAPHRYIQGKRVIDHLGRYLSIISSKRAAIIIFADGSEQIGKRILQSLQQAQVQLVMVAFGGECSHGEVDRVIAVLNNEDALVDCLIAVGGGKYLDTGKNVAYRLSIPLVICPTIASTDALCSAVSVMYTHEGVLKGAEFFPDSPTIFAVDTGDIAEAPVCHLISGMADALATWYEAQTCFQNPKARSIVGARITIAAVTIAEVCAKTVFECSLEAAAVVRQTEVNEALERVVETNTLLSGIGLRVAGWRLLTLWLAG